MSHPTALRRRTTAGCMLGALGLLAGGCQAPDEAPEAGAPPVEAPEERRFEPEMLAASPPPRAPTPTDLSLEGSFAHEPHARVDCRVCHSSVPGHDTHSFVACSGCHPAPAADQPAARVPAEECQRCHHTEQRVRGCRSCHGSGPGEVLQVRQRLDLSVRDAVLDRSLPFRHDTHGQLACADCHAATPTQPFQESCAACHADHHQASSDCATCHVPSPLELHDESAHRGCGGAGCHTSGPAEIPDSRTACITCHRAQEDHEPGGDCSSCHLWDAAGTPSGGGRP